jgi:hypothetical protein
MVVNGLAWELLYPGFVKKGGKSSRRSGDMAAGSPSECSVSQSRESPDVITNQ